MPKDDLLRIRCTAVEKERFRAAADAAGETLSEFVLLAAKLRASQQEHGSATRPPRGLSHIPQRTPVVVLSDGTDLGKRTFRPDPKK